MRTFIDLFRLLRVPFIGLGLVGTGFILLCLTVPNILHIYKSHSWPAVTGQIVEAKWQNNQISQNSLRRKYRLIPKIEYSYTVDNAVFKGTKVSLKTDDDLGQEVAVKRLEQYSLGRPVAVYYNPDQPGESFLEQEKPSLARVLGLIIAIIAFYAAITVFRKGQPEALSTTLSTIRYGNRRDLYAAVEVFLKTQRR